jgi:hypothetical protein
MATLALCPSDVMATAPRRLLPGQKGCQDFCDSDVAAELARTFRAADTATNNCQKPWRHRVEGETILRMHLVPALGPKRLYAITNEDV